MRQKFKFHIIAAALFLLMVPYKSVAAPTSHHPIRDNASKHLQKKLDQRVKALHLTRAVQQKRLAVALVDVTDPSSPHVAQINGDEMMYAASLPKIAVLLTAFELIKQGKLPLNDETRATMTRMIRNSSNRDATAMIRMVGKDYINTVMASPKYRLYDERYNGGLWVGKEYASGTAFHRDPLHHLSHGATAIQVARFYYMLETGRLVSPESSRQMKNMLSRPGINHKFVKGLSDTDAKIFRKSGSWRTYHADSAIIEHDGRSYIAVALANDSHGGEWMKQLIRKMDHIILAVEPATKLAKAADATILARVSTSPDPAASL